MDLEYVSGKERPERTADVLTPHWVSSRAKAKSTTVFMISTAVMLSGDHLLTHESRPV